MIAAGAMLLATAAAAVAARVARAPPGDEDDDDHREEDGSVGGGGGGGSAGGNEEVVHVDLESAMLAKHLLSVARGEGSAYGATDVSRVTRQQLGLANVKEDDNPFR